MSPTGSPRRARTSRDLGRQNMIQAALALLEEHDPDEITVRQIALRAGHHHRYVQDWFGGKVGLFLAVLTHVSTQLGDAIEMRIPASTPNPALVRGARLLAWLASNDPQHLRGDRMRPVLSRMEHFYHDRYGVPRDDARLLARHTALMLTAFVVFGEAYGVEENDYSRLATLQFQLGQLLGTRSGQ